jgi:hypothetical protein
MTPKSRLSFFRYRILLWARSLMYQHEMHCWDGPDVRQPSIQVSESLTSQAHGVMAWHSTLLFTVTGNWSYYRDCYIFRSILIAISPLHNEGATLYCAQSRIRQILVWQLWYGYVTKCRMCNYCNLIFRPDLIDWRSIRSRIARDRLDNAFHVAEREYGVTRLLDPEGKNTKSCMGG